MYLLNNFIIKLKSIFLLMLAYLFVKLKYQLIIFYFIKLNDENIFLSIVDVYPVRLGQS